MFRDPFRHQRRQPRKMPGQRDQKREHQIADRDRERDPRPQQPFEPLGAAERAPCPEHEQQLPGERIEVPGAARIGRQVPAELPGQRVEQHRQRERQRGVAQQQPQHRRKAGHQHDVERQHVHVDRLELQQQRLHQRHVRLLQKFQDVHFFRIERVLEAARHIGDLAHIDHEQKDMRDIDLPGALEDARARHHEAVIGHRLAIDEGRGETGHEDEDLGGVAEAVIADRDPGDDVGRDVIEIDEPERQPAKQVEPQIAVGRDRWSHYQVASGQFARRRHSPSAVRVASCELKLLLMAEIRAGR